MIRLGVVGVGHMGEYHANILKYLDKSGFIEFVGVYDINRKRMGEISKKYDIPYFDSAEDLYKQVDAIICAVWTANHYEVAKEALKANLHILIEKPFAHLYKYAEELAELAYKNNRLIQVGHVERFNGAVVELRNKYITNPLFIEAKRYGLRSDKKRDTGVILDLMVHDVDIILSLVNSKLMHFDCFAQSVFSEFEDLANAVLSFENKCIASITSSRASYIKKRTLDIAQANNHIFLNFDTQEIEIYRKTSTIFEVDQREIIYHRGAFIEKISVHVENALKDEIVHFINCIANKEEPLFKTEDDLQVLNLTLQLIKKSAEKSNFKFDIDV